MNDDDKRNLIVSSSSAATTNATANKTNAKVNSNTITVTNTTTQTATKSTTTSALLEATHARNAAAAVAAAIFATAKNKSNTAISSKKGRNNNNNLKLAAAAALAAASGNSNKKSAKNSSLTATKNVSSQVNCKPSANLPAEDSLTFPQLPTDTENTSCSIATNIHNPPANKSQQKNKKNTTNKTVVDDASEIDSAVEKINSVAMNTAASVNAKLRLKLSNNNNTNHPAAAPSNTIRTNSVSQTSINGNIPKIIANTVKTNTSDMLTTSNNANQSTQIAVAATTATNTVATNGKHNNTKSQNGNKKLAVPTAAPKSSATSRQSKPLKDSHLKFSSALPLLVGSAAAVAAAAKGNNSETSASAGAQAAAVAAAAIKQKLKNATAASAGVANSNNNNNSRSASSSTSSNSSLSSSVGIVNAISTALQNIITSDNSDTDTELYPPPVTDLSESDEESVSEDDIPESDAESCGPEAEVHEDEDDGDDEDEEDEEDEDEENDEDDEDDEEDDEEIDDEEEDEEIQDPNEVSGNFLLDTSTDRSRNLTALFEAAANEKAPVLRHATHAIDETKQALTKMRCASSPRDKTILSRTLIAACTDNDVNTVRRLLGKGNVNINESTDDGESLLSMACSAGYYELAQVLLAMSAAQVEDKGQKDCTPLMEAASAGHLEIVKLLLSHNADVNSHCATGNTPLMFACAGGHVEVVKELLKHGANVEEQNENGHTPLMEAASAGHVEVAKVLLEHGAGINTHSNEFKESALTLACYKGHLNMVRFLLQAGADQEHKTDEMHTALMEASMDGHVEVARLLLDSGAQVNMPTDSFESPLTLAACGGHVELATLLIERGANIEEVNDEGYTPLMEAAREGHEEMVALLLAKGANINATTEETQETALTLACCGGFSEVAEFLIKEGANLELGASTPLMEAAQEGHTDLVRFLLQNKANVHADTQTGDTALTHAAENGHTDAAEVLLSYGAELEHESEGGRTPLMKACRAGHLCTVKFLIQKGADVNKQTTSNDHTPLSLACAGGHQAVVELLLKSGADPFHKLKDNSTMLIEAAKGGHTRVVELLFKYPHFIQNHQNELQSATVAAATAATANATGLNNVASANAAAAGQLRLINLQQQKQLQQQQKQLQQQLQHQLQQLSAPPGLHEVSETARASNQQLFHQQQFSNVTSVSAGGEYLDDQLQTAAANANEEFAAIDINSLSAQQQEALIAKSRLFHLQAGFEHGFTQGLRDQIQAQQQNNKNDMINITNVQTLQAPSSVSNLSGVALTTAPNSASSSVAGQSKMKSVLRKSRQPPAPFELNLAPSNVDNEKQQDQQLQEARTQPLGDDGTDSTQELRNFVSMTEEEQHRYFLRRRVFMQEFKKMANDNKAAAPSLMPLTYTDFTIDSSDGLTKNSHVLQNSEHSSMVYNEADPQAIQANNIHTNNVLSDVSEPMVTALPEQQLQEIQPIQQQQQQHLDSESQQQHELSMQNQNTPGYTAAAPRLVSKTNKVTGSGSGTQITTPSEVSQSTAISDRPKVKPVSKKDAKNPRKNAFPQLPLLQQNQMVSIYNNLPLLLSSDANNKVNTMPTPQTSMNRITLPTQQQELDPKNLSLVPPSPNILPLNVTTSVALSNSPASPLASPSSSTTLLKTSNITSVIASTLVGDGRKNDSTGGFISNPPTSLASSVASSILEGSHGGLIGSQELHEALEAACCQAASTILQDASGSSESINSLNSSADMVANACGMNMAEQQEYLRKLDMNTQMKMLHLFGMRRFFDDQPKSPTETPPEKQAQLSSNTASLNYVDNAGENSIDENAEMKNLATLCSAAAAAAAVATTPQGIDITVNTISNRSRLSDAINEYDDAADEGEHATAHDVNIDDEADDDEDVEEGEREDDEEDGEEDEDELEDGDEEEDDNEEAEENDETERIHDGTECDEEDIELTSPTKTRKLSHRLENLILSNVTLKPDDLTQALCDFRQDLNGTDLVHVFPQMSNYKTASSLQQQFVQAQQSQQQKSNPDEESVGHCEMYPALEESLEQFSNDDDGAREQMYDIAVEMDEIFQVIHNVNDPSLQELTNNLNCAELADFGINSLCKTRWNGNWSQSPKWTSQDHLMSAHQQAIMSAEDQQNEQQRQANQFFLDYQLQQQLQQRFETDEIQIRDQMQQQNQQATLSLIPFSPEEAAAAAVAQQQHNQQQSLPLQNDFQLQQQHIDLEPDQELKQQLHQLQQLQQQQQSNARLLKAVAAAAAGQQPQPPQPQQLQQQQQQQTNYVFNVDGKDKSAQSLQLLFQLPPAVQQQQEQHDVAQQLQQLQQHNQDLQDLQKQQQKQQQQMKVLQQQQNQILQDISQQASESILHQQQQPLQQQQQISLDQTTQNNVRLKQRTSFASQILNQQTLNQEVLNQHMLKQRQHQLQQQLILQQQQQQQQQQAQQQPCSQHNQQQVQVATQTQSAVVVPNATASKAAAQFCPSIPMPDVGLGICAIPVQDQQSQQQNIQELPTPNVTTTATTTTTKMPGGIAKKAIDKQSRKERNRYSLLRQTPAGSQANTSAQQQFQQAVANTTIDKTIDVDSETDSNHDTALTLACAGGHEELVELLINRGANIEHRDKKGFTPLILAATAGHEKVVDILLKNGAELEAQSERTKDTPLSLACSGGRYEVVELLLSVGANKEHRNVSDYTPLSLAASGGYVNIIKLLLSNGAEINSRTGSKLGISPLMLAAMNGHTAAVKLLLDQGSDINAQIETNRNTALTLACFQGRHEVVSLLLDRKANVEHRAKTGLTPLMEAASGGYIEVGRVLLDKGADVNAAPVPTSRDTALTIAADKGHLKFVELLLSRGASVEVKNKKGNSPLWLAAHGGHLFVVEILYTHNADIDSQDNRRVSCLMAAFRKGHTKVVKWMVQYVTQFPSDQEMNRFISTISDKELSEKCYDCMKIIRAAKEAQAVKANKNASILLEELDMEKTREESRRAAAARRRERKKKKKMEKKEEKRRLMEGNDSGGGVVNASAGEDKDSDKEDDSDREENMDEDEEIHHPLNFREEGDSGIDQGSCSSTDIKPGPAQTSDKGNKNKNKKKKNMPQNPPQTTPQINAKEAAGSNSSRNTTTTNTTFVNEDVCLEQTKSGSKQDSKREESQSNTKGSKKTNLEMSANTKVNSTVREIPLKKPSEAVCRKEELPTTHLKKKESSRQREKENLAPKDSILVATNKQQSEKHKTENPKTAEPVMNPTNNISLSNSTNNSSGSRKSLVFSSSRTATNSTDDMGVNNVITKKYDDLVFSRDSHKFAPPKRGEDGWKEVVRKSSVQQQSSTSSSTNNSSTSSSTSATSTVPEMTCKKVQVPVNAISRVIGRAGSNINAIRATTGAHIEVEKQGKNQSERSITIKGLTDATRQAYMLILALIKDPDVDILQMLPRINTSIKASLPMTVGTWDNKTALPPSSAPVASSTMAAQPITTQASTASSTSTSNATNISTCSSLSASIITKSTITGKHNNVLPNKQQSSLTLGGNKSSGGRSQPAKSFYSQQQTSRGNNPSGMQSSSLSGHSKQKQSVIGDSQIHKTSGAYANSTMVQKGNMKQTQGTFSGISNTNSSNIQTFAAKLTASSQSATAAEKRQSLQYASPKKSGSNYDGNVGSIISSYGRGKPVPTSYASIPNLGGNNTITHNAFASPIGTFNAADVAVVNATAAAAAAAAAAASAVNTTATTSTVTFNTAPRTVTPIGPPVKRNTSPTLQPSLQSANISAVQQQQQQPQQQIMVIGGQHQNQNQSTQPMALITSNSLQQNAGVGNNAIIDPTQISTSGVGVGNNTTIATPSAFGTQLQTKISNEYTLFNDTYQSQWDNSQMYNPTSKLVGDSLPKADASKAPGYNRNILSSPVGSSKASSHSTSPPGSVVSNLMGRSQTPTANQQTLNVTTNGNIGIVQAANRSPGVFVPTDEGTNNQSINNSTTNAQQPLQQKPLSTNPNTVSNITDSAITSNTMKQSPHDGMGQGSTSTAALAPPPPSGLAIQRPAGSQHRAAGNSAISSGVVGNVSSIPPSSVVTVNPIESTNPVGNFGPIGSNAPGRANGPGAIGEQSINRYYDHMATQNNMAQMNYPFDPNSIMLQQYASANSSGSMVTHSMSRLNPRATTFSQSNKPQPQQQTLGSNMFHQQQIASPNYNPNKSLTPGAALAAGRPQSQAQNGQQTNQRWYNSVTSGNDYGSYVSNARDILNLENGLPLGATNSSTAISPNQNIGGHANNMMQVTQQQQPMQQQQHQDDMRKIPRPIGTERASWKYNSYGAVGGGPGGNNMIIDEQMAMQAVSGGSIGGSSGGGGGGGGGAIPPWMLDKPQNTQQQQQQHSNWMKQHYRYYGGATAGAAGGTGGMGIGGLGAAEYHHQQDQFHMAMDFHNSMPPPNMNQNQAINLIPTFPYPHFVGHSAAEMPHMPDKVELWDHHDNQTWPTNWTN